MGWATVLARQMTVVTTFRLLISNTLIENKVNKNAMRTFFENSFKTLNFLSLLFIVSN